MGYNFTMEIIKEFLSKINSQKVLVIAGSAREFESFIDVVLYKNSQEGLYEGYEFIYCNNTGSIRGMRFNSYLFYGTGIDRIGKDIDEHELSYLLEQSLIKF